MLCMELTIKWREKTELNFCRKDFIGAVGIQPHVEPERIGGYDEDGCDEVFFCHLFGALFSWTE